MRIVIADLEFEAIIGILEEERINPQRVIVNLEIDYHFRDGEYLDYVEIIDFTKSLIINKRFLLIEEAVGSLIEGLKSNFSAVEYINCQISKPDIIKECKVLVQNSKRF